MHAVKTAHQLIYRLVENILRTPDFVAHFFHLPRGLGGYMNDCLATALDNFAANASHLARHH